MSQEPADQIKASWRRSFPEVNEMATATAECAAGPHRGLLSGRFRFWLFMLASIVILAGLLFAVGESLAPGTSTKCRAGLLYRKGSWWTCRNSTSLGW